MEAVSKREQGKHKESLTENRKWEKDWKVRGRTNGGRKDKKDECWWGKRDQTESQEKRCGDKKEREKRGACVWDIKRQRFSREVAYFSNECIWTLSCIMLMLEQKSFSPKWMRPAVLILNRRGLKPPFINTKQKSTLVLHLLRSSWPYISAKNKK